MCGVSQMAKRAVYYVVGGDPGYVALLETSLASLRMYHPDAGDVGVVIMCDAEYVPHLQPLLLEHPACRVCVTDPNDDGVAVSMRKTAPPFAELAEMGCEHALYLDCDIVVCGRLDPVFDSVTEPGILYTCSETCAAAANGHAQPFWSLGLHSPETLDDLLVREVPVFNCGQFAFVPGPLMAARFANVRRLIAAHGDAPHFYEQGFMNHYFCTEGRGCADPSVLSGRVRLEAGVWEPWMEIRTRPDMLLAHFCDYTMAWRDKLAAMRQCLEDLRGERDWDPDADISVARLMRRAAAGI